MDLVGFPYEPVTFDVNEVCFDQGLNIPDADEKSRKVEELINGHKCRLLELQRSCWFGMLSIIGCKIR